MDKVKWCLINIDLNLGILTGYLNDTNLEFKIKR